MSQSTLSVPSWWVVSALGPTIHAVGALQFGRYDPRALDELPWPVGLGGLVRDRFVGQIHPGR